MRLTLFLGSILSLMLGGCFLDHTPGEVPPDAGGDGSPWASCEAGVREGDPCVGSWSCPGPDSCAPGSLLACLGGTVTEIYYGMCELTECSPAASVGDPCSGDWSCPATCTDPMQLACVSGVVAEIFVGPCADADPTGPICGGEAGEPCAAGFWCDFEDDSCGGFDGTGICRPQPGACDLGPDPPVCGCDGRRYDSWCLAAASGVDVAARGSCPGL